MYAQERQKKPTVGTARDGGHPSTEFGRALEEIFLIIGVRAHVKRAAEWAIDELTEEDFHLPKAGRGLLPTSKPRGIVVEALRRKLSKGEDQ